MRKTLLLLSVITLLLSSCSITKRKYLPGYSIQWNKHKVVPKTEEHKDNTPTDKSATASIDTKSDIIATPPPYAVVDTPQCDEITLLNGTLIKGKVEEIGVDEIKYKDCDNLSGPIIDADKSTVFMIRYANGKRTVINSAETKQEDNQPPPTIIYQPVPTPSPQYNNDNSPPPHPANTGIRVFGIILLLTGFIVLWLVSILIGVILLILGLILVIV